MSYGLRNLVYVIYIFIGFHVSYVVTGYAIPPFPPQPFYPPPLPGPMYGTMPRMMAPSSTFADPYVSPLGLGYPMRPVSPHRLAENEKFLREMETIGKTMRTAAAIEYLNNKSEGGATGSTGANPSRSRAPNKKNENSPLNIKDLMNLMEFLQHFTRTDGNSTVPHSEGSHLDLQPQTVPKGYVVTSGGLLPIVQINNGSIAPPVTQVNPVPAANLVVPEMNRPQLQPNTLQLVPVGTLQPPNTSTKGGDYAVMQRMPVGDPNVYRIIG